MVGIVTAILNPTQARTFNGMFNDIRGYYAANVVGRVQGFDGDSVAVHNYEDVPGAIPIPATLSLELGSVIAGRGVEDIAYRLVSDFPFANRAPHNLDGFETKALADFRASRDPEQVATEITGSLFERQIRMAVPVMLGQACVSCHNIHP